MSSSSATMLLKLLQTSIRHEKTSERTVQRWFQKFCGADESLKDEGRGWPHIFQIEDLRAIIEQNPD